MGIRSNLTRRPARRSSYVLTSTSQLSPKRIGSLARTGFEPTAVHPERVAPLYPGRR